MVEANNRSFKKMFPYLHKELTSRENTVSIDSVQTTPEEKDSQPDVFHNYNPNVVDFLRRCKTEHEANEIIEYLEKRTEITKDQAKQLKKQLKEKGVRSFGPKKEDDYYFKQSGLC